MNAYLWAVTFILLSSISLQAIARPIAYPDGVMVMSMNNGDDSVLDWHFSPSATYALGYKGMYAHDSQLWFHGLQNNFRLWRANLPASQANAYLLTSVGVAANDDTTRAAGLLGVAVDWEDRRYYTAYENQLMEAGSLERRFMQKARIGIAPYVAEYGALHTWLMLEVRHAPTADDPVLLTPLVRLFQGDVMVEAGWRTDNTPLLNLNLQF